MTIQEFANEVIQTLKEKFPQYFSGAQFEIQKIPKPGNLILTGISIRMNEAPIAPLYYLDQPHLEGRSVYSIAEDIVDKMVRHATMPSPIDVDIASSFEKAKDYIVPRLIDIRPGSNDAYLQTRPVTILPYADIGVIYDVALPNKDDYAEASIPVTDELQRYWMVSNDELHNVALINGPKLRPFVLKELSEMLHIPDAQYGCCPMTVLTTNVGCYGASAILYSEAQEAIKNLYPLGAYLIPSSCHEWIVIPKDTMPDIEMGITMVKSINATVVMPQDRLADDVLMLDDSGHLVSALY